MYSKNSKILSVCASLFCLYWCVVAQYFNNHKAKLKKVVSDLTAEATGTGGGPALAASLSDMDMRFVALMGPGFGQGNSNVRVNPFPNTNGRGTIPQTKFTCNGRGSGYYADMETGCQVYHMCDGLGRQFSYTCPNTTLFQQRMLICDHWYMVNCSMSERDYDANLLIGQRDKPFVSDAEMRQRTPRPDILSVPPNSNYFDGLKEAETKFQTHPGNSIVGVADSISSADNNGLDSAKQNYRPPTSWSTKKPRNNRGNIGPNVDALAEAASQRPEPTVEIKPEDVKITVSNIAPPSRELVPPVTPANEDSFESKLDVRMGDDDLVFKFIKRFDPNSPTSHKTSMTRTEIIDLNKQLPEGQISSEDDRTPKKTKNFENSSNKVSNNDKGFTEGSRFETVNIKPTSPTEESSVPVPDTVLKPPKTEYSKIPTSTVGPPVYYEWKWAVPAFDLELPKIGNETEQNTTTLRPKTEPRSPFRDVTRSTIADEDMTPRPRNTEYNISSYFVPDYVFPLDNPHPGYEDDQAETSFQVKIDKSRSGRSYGENPACPHCHPAYMNPGSCEPCIKR